MRFGSASFETEQYWQQQKARDLALADYMLSNDPSYLAKIREIDSWLLEQSVPDIFDDGDSRNVSTIARQKFIKLCAALAETYNQPENLTLVAFHGAIDHITQKHEGGKE
jgi:hypothetical protein